MSYLVVSCENLRQIGPYVDALKAVGVAAERIRLVTPEGPKDDWAHLAAQAAGILLCGGPDVEPHRYGEEPLPGVEFDLLPELDSIELAALEGAKSERVPVLGLCRGIQVANVFLGGSLWQDLPAETGSAVAHRMPRPEDALAHAVAVRPTPGWLGELLGREAVYVNSRHHQGVRRLAPELETVATSADGLVEAASLRSAEWWFHAVQWHPENLLPLAQQRELFRGFAAAAGMGPERSEP
ncbi:MAG TPA: gamma-glutamyl-gamma-aminobutyrate hydrolase family protein [Thermoanaerobaculia bacterium]|nr:gamma-glutamyl-gamma-aminobutyrate hydrolase family protein [Thermoanaerobaculia bacterium]